MVPNHCSTIMIALYFTTQCSAVDSNASQLDVSSVEIPHPKYENGLCHTTDLGYVNYTTYVDLAFTLCYMELFPNSELAHLWTGLNCSVWFGFPHSSVISLFSSFLNTEEQKDRWFRCVKASLDCCQMHMVKTVPATNLKTCPATWDGLQCWKGASADEIIYGTCPFYYISFCPYYGIAYSEKKCIANGNQSWEVAWDQCRNSHREISSYKECHKSDVVSQMVRNRLLIRDIVLCINVLVTLPALIIFIYFKALRRGRKDRIIHVNFLISHQLTSVLFIVYDVIIVLPHLDDSENPVQTGTWCMLFTLLVHKYFMLTKYSWMFVECYFLHRQVVAPFQSNDYWCVCPMMMAKLMAIGWLFPLLPTASYTVARMLAEEQADACWTHPAGNLEWFINGCIVTFFVLSVFFVGKVSNVINKKLKPSNYLDMERHEFFRRLFNAIVFMLPLVGITYFPTFYRPRCYVRGYHQYQIVDSILLGMQGSLVALVFCYMNHEVRNRLKRGWKNTSMAIESRFSYHNTRHTSLGRDGCNQHEVSSMM